MIVNRPVTLRLATSKVDDCSETMSMLIFGKYEIADRASKCVLSGSPRFIKPLAETCKGALAMRAT